MGNMIPSINLHLTKKCNMKCKYCFAGFSEIQKEIDFKETKKLLIELKNFGFEKVNFVGGEPLLIAKLIELLQISRDLGFYISVTTNGTLITDSFLRKAEQLIDMIGISIDSLDENTNYKIGRVWNKKPLNYLFYNNFINMIKSTNINLKINTVVSLLNKEENFSDFINTSNPERWKVFQVLKIENENNINFSNFEISTKDFDYFCKKHQIALMNKNILIKEENQIIRGSYLMVNPEGKFFDNELGYYNCSEKILSIGVKKALSQIYYSYSKFKKRNGDFYHNNIKIAV